MAHVPLNEDLRLQDLRLLNILDTPNEPDFDGLAELASQICNCPVSLISFVDQDRQWFKAKKGFAVCESARDISFCAHAIQEEEVFIIENALDDERFMNNPLVTSGFKLRFYAGAPLYSSNGYKLGTVCVADNKPRKLEPSQIQALKIISAQVTQLLELRTRNQVIKEQAERMITIEKQVAQQTLLEQETERALFGRELHENFAQSLTATKLYLESAEASESLRLHFLQKTKQCIVQVLDDMRNFSTSITPSTLKTDNLIDTVNLLIDQYKQKSKLQICFTWNEAVRHTEAGKALAVFRNIQEQLKYIHQQQSASNVSIRILANSHLQMIIEDDSVDFSSFTGQSISRLNNIKTRTEYFGGNATLMALPGKGCSLKATIPL